MELRSWTGKEYRYFNLEALAGNHLNKAGINFKEIDVCIGIEDSELRRMYTNDYVFYRGGVYRVEWVKDLGRVVLAEYRDKELFKEIPLTSDMSEECFIVGNLREGVGEGHIGAV